MATNRDLELQELTASGISAVIFFARSLARGFSGKISFNCSQGGVTHWDVEERHKPKQTAEHNLTERELSP
jgi:hypothetical protein